VNYRIFMQMRSLVETSALAQSRFLVFRYEPVEKIDVIVTDSLPDLGKLMALRFIEFVLSKPDGVISLPTGKTPEYFIKWVSKIVDNWETGEIRQLLRDHNLNTQNRPDFKNLRFIQMDEIFPINPLHKNSFNHFVRRFYLDGFGLSPDRCMLLDTHDIPNIDLLEDGYDLNIMNCTESILSEKEIGIKQVLMNVEKYCKEYEDRIRALGGIDFFLGGIGPDGHIAFNIPGSDPLSGTRIVKLDYETLASSVAGSVGGMTKAKKKNAISIGLGTITANPNCSAIIAASGESKRPPVQSAVENETDIGLFPAHAIRKLVNSVFYLTVGSAKSLSRFKSELGLTNIPREILKFKIFTIKEIACKKILHTEPHHDDILLGYLPVILDRERIPGLDTFVCATSGFNSVSDERIMELAQDCISFDSIPDKNSDSVQQFVQGKRLCDNTLMDQAFARRFRSDVEEIFHPSCLMDHLAGMARGNHFEKVPLIQKLKGRCREFESECLWALSGLDVAESVHHLRLGFYSSDVFTPERDFARDVAPCLDLLMNIQPDIVTLALDPESTGPDTHFRVLQCLAISLVQYKEITGKSPVVWGYRNVWHKFELDETDRIFPVTETRMDQMEELFMSCYRTQRRAEFPSYELDGPFSTIMRRTWEAQLEVLKRKLGSDCPFSQDVKGVIFMKELSVEGLLSYSKSLKY
jgi:glucosamine-6-phosphate deaminase